MESACEFYAELLGELGGKQLFGMDRIQFFGTGPGAPMLAVCAPYDEKAPEPGNGTMIAIPAGDPAGVDRIYGKAIELGATDDGAPGPRNPVFYGAYVRDADGNKLCFYEMKTQPIGQNPMVERSDLKFIYFHTYLDADDKCIMFKMQAWFVKNDVRLIQLAPAF